MEMNDGTTDRVLRIVVGLILIGLTLMNVIGLWGCVGLVFLVTAGFGFCPAYSFSGINTCKAN